MTGVAGPSPPATELTLGRLIERVVILAEQSPSKLPGAVGAVVGLLILGGLVTTPFYLQPLRDPGRQLDTLVAEDVEIIRRATLQLDADLARLQALYDALGDDALDASAAEALLEKNADLFDQETLTGFNRTLQALRSLDEKDQNRGTSMATAGQPLPPPKPNLRTAFADMRGKVLKSQTDALVAAENSVRKVLTLSVGDVRAKNHLTANRVAAMLYFAKGQFARHRALVDRKLGLERLFEAEALAVEAQEVLRTAAAVLARRPEAALKKAEDNLRQAAQQSDQLNGQIAALSEAVAAAEKRIAELNRIARDARAELARLESSGAPIHEPDSKYLDLSDQARRAEAEAQALARGTLADATIVRPDASEFGEVAYEGGRRQPGLVDLKRQLDRLREQLAWLDALKTAAQGEQSTLADQVRHLTEQAGQIEGEAAGQSTQVREHVARANEDFTRSAEAADDATKAFAQAENYAKQASVKAQHNISAARNQSPKPDTPEADRLEMLKDDTDTEAALRGLAAESAYHHALVLAEQMLTLHARHEVEERIAAALGSKPPADIADQIADLRERAKDQLEAAVIAFGYAERLTSASRARTSQGVILGKTYLWQVKLGQAAVELLQAALAFDDPDMAQTEKQAAYDLLSEAIQGREQSPLLSPAIAAFRQIQQNPG